MNVGFRFLILAVNFISGSNLDSLTAMVAVLPDLFEDTYCHSLGIVLCAIVQQKKHTIVQPFQTFSRQLHINIQKSYVTIRFHLHFNIVTISFQYRKMRNNTKTSLTYLHV